MPAPFALDFHDSEVRAIDAEGDTLRVRFSAAHVRRDSDASLGYLDGVEIAATHASCRADVALAFGRLVAGRLRRDGHDVPPAIPLRLAGALSLELHFANGTRLEIAAGALAIHAEDATRFQEDFSC